MYHSLVIDSSINHQLQIDILDFRLSELLKNIETAVGVDVIDGFSTTSTSSGFFVSTVSSSNSVVCISLACRGNNGLLINLAKNICEKYQTTLTYDFWCDKEKVIGKLNFDESGFNGDSVKGYEEICSYVDQKIGSIDFFKRIATGTTNFKGFSIIHLSEVKSKYLNTSFYTNKFKLSSKNEDIYFKVELEEAKKFLQFPDEEMLIIENKNYFISSVTWSNDSDFKIECLLHELSSNEIMKNALELSQVA